MRTALIHCLVLLVLVLSGAAWAACTNPDGEAGTLVYNTDYTILQYCRGTEWVGVPGPGCDCPVGDTLIMGSATWECSSGGACAPLVGSGFLGFTDLTDQATSATISSNILQATAGGSISISGDGSPAYRICADDACNTENHTWSSAGSIDDGEFLQLRLMSSGSGDTTHSATVTVGSASDQWSVNTGDDAPDAFTFSDQTDVATGTVISSNTINITGITGSVSVSIGGQGSPQFRVNGGSWTSGPSTINNGQSLQLRLTSSASPSTMNSATVTVGTASDQWDVTTVACNGDVVGGYCWYLGGSNQSCTSVCSYRGGCNLAGIRDYAGPGGTNNNCELVLEALGFSVSFIQTVAVESGCYYNQGNYRRGTDPTTCGYSQANHERACACNN